MMLDRNTCCAPETLDRGRLDEVLSARLGIDRAQALAQSHPYLFAGEQVYLAHPDFCAMRQSMETIERVVRGAAWRELIFAGQAEPPTDPGTLGVFSSYDFHVTDSGPALIEINTNAGGAFLAASCAEAHEFGCVGRAGSGETVRWRPESIADMFAGEWKRAGRAGALRTIAIVDDAPQHQFLFPEFELAQSLLAESGFETVIADAADLTFASGRLMAGRTEIDLVYNRLTDFALGEPAHRALRQAMLADAAVVTPHPFHHALLADKRNLVRLTSPTQWDQLGLDDQQREVLGRVPHAEVLSAENADRFWAERKDWFFKPWAGFGAKGVYRGDKLTRKAWDEIKRGGYIAQRAVPPSSRRVRAGVTEALLKTDIRVYAYGEAIVFVAARLYQGQTTNMRTIGGGFAPVRIG